MKPEAHRVKKGCVFVGQRKQYAEGETLDPQELHGNVWKQMDVLEVTAPKTAKKKEDK
jgi:hypothetical protein